MAAVPSATSGANRGRARGIKRERESLNSLPSDNEVTSETNQNTSRGPATDHSLESATDTPGMAPPLSYRHGRSDARTFLSLCAFTTPSSPFPFPFPLIPQANGSHVSSQTFTA